MVKQYLRIREYFHGRHDCQRHQQKQAEAMGDIARRLVAVKKEDAIANKENAGRAIVLKRQFSQEKLLLVKQHDEALARLPNRMVGEGSLTASSLYSLRGRRGINQDTMVVWEGFSSPESSLFAGVFDGQGLCGHLVSHRVRDSLPTLLAAKFVAACEAERRLLEGIAEEARAMELEEKLLELWQKAHETSFKLLDSELRQHPLLEGAESGADVITALVQDHHLIVSSIGDSHCVLACAGDDGRLMAHHITANERAEPRYSVNGRGGEQLSSQMMPWPAVTRSLGSGPQSDQGHHLHPQMFHRPLEANDEFCILASDGLWNVLEGQEAVDIVASSTGPSGAAKALVSAAERRWAEGFPQCPRDDITAVVVFLAHLRPPPEEDYL